MKQRAVIRSFLAEVSPAREVRRLMETDAGYDAAVWRRMAEAHAMPGLLVPGRFGGPGGGWPEMALVLEEMGRVLLCAPFLSTAVLAPTAILASGDTDAGHRWLPPIAAGRLTATVAVAEAGTWGGQVTTTATPTDAGGHRLEGRKEFVLDGHVAELLVVAAQGPSGPSQRGAQGPSGPSERGARGGGGVSLFAVEGDAAGLARTLSPTMDQTRKLARVELSSTPARLIGPPGGGPAVLRRVLDVGAVALAAEQVGGAQRCLEMAVDHAANRYQFGRPIGSFQAVKHKCADMLLAVESARAAAGHAVEALGGPVSPALKGRSGPRPPGAGLTVAASLAKVCCSEAFFRVAADTIQLHGALGVSWDHDAHLYFKRATASRLLFGDPSHHRRRLADQLGL
jgi:alkylation response protein AidB-like acyl-CoA dehydrogenase